MSIRFYNTLTRNKDEFVPLRKGEAGIYHCGPTVYDHAHIGNFRAFLFDDLLRRYMEYRGYRVTQIMNVTDVDDKTIRASRQQGIPLRAHTDKYLASFLEDFRTLNIKQPAVMPRATEHIREMCDLILRLEANGHTYESQGSIYFRIASLPGYGRLSGMNPEEVEPGRRVDSDEYAKEDARDFVLWKEWTEEDGDVFWEGPGGRKGRPGWHIECSAMSTKYLGETFDIHTGAVDLIFPHHENEIAQSTGATGKPFVRYWLHNEYLQVEGRKMAKSLGNFYTLKDLVQRGMDPLAIRYLLLATHYRQALNFTFDGVTGARAAVRQIKDFAGRMRERGGNAKGGTGVAETAVQEAISALRAGFTDAMDDDLNVSPALAAIFQFMNAVNRSDPSPAGATAALQALSEIEEVLGLREEAATDRGLVEAPTAEAAGPEELLASLDAALKSGDSESARRAVEGLASLRARFRNEKKFAEGDEIRHTLRDRGIALEDVRNPDGTFGVRWKRL